MVLMPGRWYLYHHIIPDNDTVFYVGVGISSRPFETRKSERSENWFVQFNKTGVQVKIIKEFTIRQEALIAEIEEIRSLKEKGHPLVNITNGGNGRLGLKPWNTGIKAPYSQETLDKRVASGKKYIDSPGSRDKHAISCGSTRVFQVFKNGIVVWEGINQRQCARDLKIRQADISYRLRKCKSEYKGFTFKYKVD